MATRIGKHNRVNVVLGMHGCSTKLHSSNYRIYWLFTLKDYGNQLRYPPDNVVIFLMVRLRGRKAIGKSD